MNQSALPFTTPEPVWAFLGVQWHIKKRWSY